MEPTRLDFKRLRVQLSLQYGIELDDTSITILTVLRQDLKRQFAKIDREQEEMAGQIKLSKKSLQVDTAHPSWQAFWHGMGQWGLGLCLAVFTAAIFLTIDWSRQSKEKQQLQQELAWYKEHYEAAQKINTSAGADLIKKKSKSKKK